MNKEKPLDSLEKKISYEKWLLENLLKVLNNNQNNNSNYIIFINDKYDKDLMKINEYIGSNHSKKSSVELIKLLSPLIFGANYKILDIIMEYILQKNQKNFNSFIEKINYLQKNKDHLKYPNLFNNCPELFDRLFGLYTKLRSHRNFLIHNKWGENKDGNLHFNFNYKENTYNIIVDFEQVISWAESLIICINELCNNSNVDLDNYYIETIKACLNDLKSIHGYKNLKTKSLRYFQVVSKNTLTLEQKKINIDFKKIRKILEKRNQFGDIIYMCDLIIEINSPDITQRIRHKIYNPKDIDNINLIKDDKSFVLCK